MTTRVGRHVPALRNDITLYAGFSENEAGEPSSHSFISHVRVPPLHPLAVRRDIRSLVSIEMPEQYD